MSKQRIWSTGIIVAWTPAIYICPEWMWKAPLKSKIPVPAHLIILVIYVTTSYDEPSADPIIVDGLKCAV